MNARTQGLSSKLLPEFTQDTVTIKRASLTVDAEGDDTGAFTTVYLNLSCVYGGIGLWAQQRRSGASPTEQADQREQVIDAEIVVAAGLDVRLGDFAITRGKTYVIDRVIDVHGYLRLLLKAQPN